MSSPSVFQMPPALLQIKGVRGNYLWEAYVKSLLRFGFRITRLCPDPIVQKYARDRIVQKTRKSMKLIGDKDLRKRLSSGKTELKVLYNALVMKEAIAMRKLLQMAYGVRGKRFWEKQAIWNNSLNSGQIDEFVNVTQSPGGLIWHDDRIPGWGMAVLAMPFPLLKYEGDQIIHQLQSKNNLGRKWDRAYRSVAILPSLPTSIQDDVAVPYSEVHAPKGRKGVPDAAKLRNINVADVALMYWNKEKQSTKSFKSCTQEQLKTSVTAPKHYSSSVKSGLKHLQPALQAVRVGSVVIDSSWANNLSAKQIRQTLQEQADSGAGPYRTRADEVADLRSLHAARKLKQVRRSFRKSNGLQIYSTWVRGDNLHKSDTAILDGPRLPHVTVAGKRYRKLAENSIQSIAHTIMGGAQNNFQLPANSTRKQLTVGFDPVKSVAATVGGSAVRRVNLRGQLRYIRPNNVTPEFLRSKRLQALVSEAAGHLRATEENPPKKKSFQKIGK